MAKQFVIDQKLDDIKSELTGVAEAITGRNGMTNNYDPRTWHRLNDYFHTAEALHAAIAAGDFSHIHINDYWEMEVSGTMRDYSSLTIPSGTTYYSNEACTTVKGTLASDAPAYFNGAPDSTSVYVRGVRGDSSTTIKGYALASAISNYYNNVQINKTIRFYVVAINHYKGVESMKSESMNFGSNNLGNHVVFMMLDGIDGCKKSYSRYATRHIQTAEKSVSESSIQLSAKQRTVYIEKNGTVLLPGTAYTLSTNVSTSMQTISFAQGSGVSSGDTVKIGYLTIGCQEGLTNQYPSYTEETFLFDTLNDTDYGFISLINSSDAVFCSHIFNGPNGKGIHVDDISYDLENYLGTSQSVVKNNTTVCRRGKIFIPYVEEIYGYSRLSYQSKCFMDGSWYGFSFKPMQFDAFVGRRSRDITGPGYALVKEKNVFLLADTFWCGVSGISNHNFYEVSASANGVETRSNLYDVVSITPTFIFC